jgi:hypothetical protein
VNLFVPQLPNEPDLRPRSASAGGQLNRIRTRKTSAYSVCLWLADGTR